jgi:hypothetical protein
MKSKADFPNALPTIIHLLYSQWFFLILTMASKLAVPATKTVFLLKCFISLEATRACSQPKEFKPFQTDPRQHRKFPPS